MRNAPIAVQPSPAVTRRRSDARRNQELILEAARTLFIAEGVLVPFDEIARRAGVGNATLYRHFPTRDALVLAAIQQDITAIQHDADQLGGAGEPNAALRAWLVELVWHLRTWHGLPETVIEALNTASPLAMACTPLQQRTDLLLAAAQQAGVADVTATAEELFQLVTLLSWGADRFGDDKASARRRTEQALFGVLRPEIVT